MAKLKEPLSSGTKRVQMDLPPKSVERLKRLQEYTEAVSYAEVMRNALRLYEALVIETENGNEVLIKRGDQIVRLPIFGA
ncbi:MAG: hypothetical protein ACTHN4_03455 [Sphingomicrobium sp.]